MKHPAGCPCDTCVEEHLRQSTLSREGEDLARQVADYVNHHSVYKHFVEGMSCQHRTLQAAFTRLCINWFQHLANLADKGPGYYDLRNEAAVKLAKAITETEAWKEHEYIPVI